MNATAKATSEAQKDQSATPSPKEAQGATEPKEAKAPKAPKTPKPVKLDAVYDMTKVGDPAVLMIERRGVKKKPSRQLCEILAYIRAEKMTKIPGKELFASLERMKEGKTNAGLYPGVHSSVQKVESIFKFYMGRGDTKLCGITKLDS
jgi:hypothetical protein